MSTLPSDARASSPDQPAKPARLTAPFGTGYGWQRAIREFAVIVAGVLAALGAQAWWEGRQEREREREYLHQLLMDTRENERRLENSIALDSVSGWSQARLVTALQSSRPLPSSDSLTMWTLSAVSTSNFQPVTGTYRAIVSAGDLRLLRNDTVRSRVIGYAATLENSGEMLQLFMQHVISMAVPLARTLPFIRTAFLGDASQLRGDFEPVRNDRDFAALLFALQAANNNRLTHLRMILAETQELRRVLEAEPDSRATR
jgi:hypothetical protein